MQTNEIRVDCLTYFKFSSLCRQKTVCVPVRDVHYVPGGVGGFDRACKFRPGSRDVPAIGCFIWLQHVLGFLKWVGSNNSSDTSPIELLFFLFTICYVRHETYQATMVDFVR